MALFPVSTCGLWGCGIQFGQLMVVLQSDETEEIIPSGWTPTGLLVYDEQIYTEATGSNSPRNLYISLHRYLTLSLSWSEPVADSDSVMVSPCLCLNLLFLGYISLNL